MSENLNRGARDFSKYNTMATADLEEILRLDAESPEGTESDTELLLYVMGVLAERRRNNGNAGKTAFEAWESFEKYYMPEDGTLTESPAEKTGVRHAPWLRRAVAAAAVVALLVCLPFTANALGLGELWDILAHWAKETFSFVSGDAENYSEPTPDSREEFTSLQDALQKSNRDPSIVPTWIPDGFILESVAKNISPTRESYVAFYIKDADNYLRILIQTYLSSDPNIIEKSDDLVEVYTVVGVDYYIFRNMDSLKAMCVQDSYECCITGNVSMDEMKLMIDSIGKE